MQQQLQQTQHEGNAQHFRCVCERERERERERYIYL
jgi:hypothetical protein